jgi:hypothetical protein
VASPGPAAIDPAAAARDVFQDPAFWWKRIEPRRTSNSWLDSLLAALRDLVNRILDAVGELIGWILGRLFGAFSGASSAGRIVVWLAIAALLAWAIWKLYPVIVRWLRGGAPVPALPRQEVSWQTLAEASDLYTQAGQAFGAGQYAEAIRLALLALIARLEKQGLLRYDTTRTNREYQRELRPQVELAACFGELARIYERVWYGRLPAGHADAELALGLCGSVINGKEPAPE